jgi:hypothetical protein
MTKSKIEDKIEGILKSEEENKIQIIENLIKLSENISNDLTKILDYIDLFNKNIISEFKCLKKIDEILFPF